MTNLASRTTGSDALSVLSGSHRLASRWCGTPPRMRRGPATSGTRKRVSPRMTSLLCLLSEERDRQPRAVYKYWVGGLPSCDHAATCSSSSSSVTADMDQKDRCGCMYKAGIAGYFAPRAVFPSLVGRPRVLRILAGTDLKYSCSGMCKAGFSGVSAPHAVLPEVYRKIGFWEMALIFLRPLVSGSHLFELFA